MRVRGLAIAMIAGVLLPAALAAQSSDPVLWPEPQRAFLQDGPGLLLSAEQRREFLSLDETGRESFLERFLVDPIPATPINELAEGIARRRRLAFESLPPGDARAQLVFLLGKPDEARVIDCGSTFRPLEIWTYGLPPNQRTFILYRAAADEPFRVWLPIDSKRALYTPDMANWIYDWTAIGMGGKRIDRRFCPQSADVDELTGIDGLRSRPAEKADVPKERNYHWTAPEDRVSELARPKDLAAWAKKAAEAVVPPEPPRLAVETLDMDFPDRREQRMVSRILIGLRPPGAEGGVALAADEGKTKIKLLVDGVIEREGSAFDALRVRYRLPVPEQGPIALFLERTLRPDESFLMRLTIRDEVSGAETRVVRGFRVPSKPEVRLAPKAALAAARGEILPPGIGGRDSVLLMPPIDEVMLGTWRADAMVSGDRIAKVVFLVDGEAQLSRTRPPYSAEVRLSSFPREQVVRVECYDSAGELVAADQVTVNQTRGAFRVTVAEPAEGAKIARRGARALVRAEVTVPEDRRVESVEMKVNDRLVATLTSPPWQAEVDVPDEEIVHLAVSAELDDGHRTEAVRFLRAPENLEHVEVNLVELYTTVTDATGSLIRGLTADDFQVLEAGRPQQIARFELVENLPLTLGFAIDTSVSMASSLSEAQRAAEGFLRKLQPHDRAFAVGFSSRPYLVMPPTDDLEAVSQSLEGLSAMGRTAIHDGLITSLYYFRGYRGQRALILLTDGEDTSSNTPWEKALEYARRSGVAIYTVGLNVPAISMEVRNHLSELAEATGGRVFYVERADELAGVYGEIEHELRSRYYLAYNSDRPEDEGFRPVEVKVKRGRARTMRGYYP
ncbi:MAG TPA: VWA domain-containing protein [Thermoanaerobaculia bacterium]|nr:VWA domain-containing protein [Thermoanaerobaculia bacterium]